MGRISLLAGDALLARTGAEDREDVQEGFREEPGTGEGGSCVRCNDFLSEFSGE